MPNLIIGSRGSKLALWQSNWVKDRLEEAHTGLVISIEIIKTTGDKLTEASLAQIGGKGVFTKEIEEALLDHRVDLAVHSLKDLPTTLPPGLHIAAVTEREDVRDALIVNDELRKYIINSIGDLPQNARVGTSSLRRASQLRHVRPDLQIVDLRGNVETRLRKLDEGDYEAIILASAGLKRLGFSDRITAYIPTSEMLTAVGQGALGIETRIDDHRANLLLEILNHAPTRFATEAERAVLRNLGGGCAVPIAAFAHVKKNRISQKLMVDALVADVDGQNVVRRQIGGSVQQAEELGSKLAEMLVEDGAHEMLARIGSQAPDPVQTIGGGVVAETFAPPPEPVQIAQQESWPTNDFESAPPIQITPPEDSIPSGLESPVQPATAEPLDVWTPNDLEFPPQPLTWTPDAPAATAEPLDVWTPIDLGFSSQPPTMATVEILEPVTPVAITEPPALWAADELELPERTQIAPPPEEWAASNFETPSPSPIADSTEGWTASNFEAPEQTPIAPQPEVGTPEVGITSALEFSTPITIAPSPEVETPSVLEFWTPIQTSPPPEVGITDYLELSAPISIAPPEIETPSGLEFSAPIPIAESPAAWPASNYEASSYEASNYEASNFELTTPIPAAVALDEGITNDLESPAPIPVAAALEEGATNGFEFPAPIPIVETPDAGIANVGTTYGLEFSSPIPVAEPPEGGTPNGLEFPAPILIAELSEGGIPSGLEFTTPILIAEPTEGGISNGVEFTSPILVAEQPESVTANGGTTNGLEFSAPIPIVETSEVGTTNGLEFSTPIPIADLPEDGAANGASENGLEFSAPIPFAEPSEVGTTIDLESPAPNPIVSALEVETTNYLSTAPLELEGEAPLPPVSLPVFLEAAPEVIPVITPAPEPIEAITTDSVPTPVLQSETEIEVKTESNEAQRPLSRRRVIVTRAIKQSGEMTRVLEALGAEVTPCPTIEIRDPSNWAQLDRALIHLSWYDWLVFTSANGVEYFLRRLDELGHGRAELMSHRICAVGRKTAERLKSENLTVDLTPDRFTAEAVVEDFIKRFGVRQRLRGTRMLLPASRTTRDVIRPAMEKIGVYVEVVEAYQTVAPSAGGAEVAKLFRSAEADYIIFTSPSTVANLAAILETDHLAPHMANTRVACIGPVTAEAARLHGLTVHIQPEEHTGQAVVTAIVADSLER